jgi:nucleoside 2-deoxyribosyltransferase
MPACMPCAVELHVLRVAPSHRYGVAGMKLYLAGPDVFLSDAVEIGRIKQELCRRHGFAGLFPLDDKIPSSGPLSKAIFDGNIAMLNQADAVLANLTPFRGVSADVGTVFEVGYGYACGKKVYGYSNIRTCFIDRIREFIGASLTQGADGRPYAADGLAVEDFDRFDNLMIAEALLASGFDVVTPSSSCTDPLRDMEVFEECLRRIRIAADRAPRNAAAG